MLLLLLLLLFSIQRGLLLPEAKNCIGGLNFFLQNLFSSRPITTQFLRIPLYLFTHTHTHYLSYYLYLSCLSFSVSASIYFSLFNYISHIVSPVYSLSLSLSLSLSTFLPSSLLLYFYLSIAIYRWISIYLSLSHTDEHSFSYMYA